MQALIRQEILRKGIQREDISDSEAKRYYRQHRAKFSYLVNVTLDAVVVRNLTIAQRVLRLARGSSEAEFHRLAAIYGRPKEPQRGGKHFMVVDELSEHTPGRPPHSGPLEPEVHPVALGMRAKGDVGLAKGNDGRYYVIRAQDLVLRTEPWSRKLIPTVKIAMVEERYDSVLADLDQRLRRAVIIRLDGGALTRIPVPSN